MWEDRGGSRRRTRATKHPINKRNASSPSRRNGTPLRQRMIDDVTIRILSATTQAVYTHWVNRSGCISAARRIRLQSRPSAGWFVLLDEPALGGPLCAVAARPARIAMRVLCCCAHAAGGAQSVVPEPQTFGGRERAQVGCRPQHHPGIFGTTYRGENIRGRAPARRRSVSRLEVSQTANGQGPGQRRREGASPILG